MQYFIFDSKEECDTKNVEIFNRSITYEFRNDPLRKSLFIFPAYKKNNKHILVVDGSFLFLLTEEEVSLLKDEEYLKHNNLLFVSD